jgi:hypothetical protein
LSRVPGHNIEGRPPRILTILDSQGGLAIFRTA